MSFKDNITKEFGPALSKAVISALFGSLRRSGEHPADATEYSSAWKEIEQKLQGLFANDEADRARRRNSQWVAFVVVVVGFVALAYLYGRRRGRRQAAVLEVRKV